MRTNLLLILAALLTALAFGIIGWSLGRKSVHIPEPTIIERIDTVTVTEVVVDTIYRIRTETAYLERIDTVTNTIIDSVYVQIPISRYEAHEDSLYTVVATGYDVEFESIEVYPKTITEERYIETVIPMRWGIGLQAGYGATICDKSVRLAPYVGIGLTYNIFAF